MLLSSSRAFIFIHIQKTGGSSIVSALRKAAPDSISTFSDFAACHDPLKGQHVFASDLRNYLGDHEWQRFFKFAFVRNPWARLVSWYNMCIERPANEFMTYVQANAHTFEAFLDLTSGIAAKTKFKWITSVTRVAFPL
jgi:chondroitin 4-sulfotransferase 11